MVQHRDFDADVENHESPCSFRLGGREWHARAVDDVPFAAMEALLTGSDDAAQQMALAKTFFRAVLVEGDAFADMLSDPAAGVSFGKLRPVMEYLSEHVFGRPTQPPDSSQAGRQEIESASTAG